jgi:phosphatidylserine/phosphatidylglycerophosphate/cardiolipin synthase-like enzyme
MEKLNFTPEEYREYRESEGLGWPPKSRGERLLDLIRAEAERTGVPVGDLVDKFVSALREKGLPG